jgi:lipid-A-disaccharide synthase-like uncharacterized protein
MLSSSLSQAASGYLHNVFVMKLNWPVLLGFAGQSLFVMGFTAQWLASERARRSVVPVAFWGFSIGGGVLMLFYALYIRDPVVIFGQGLGLFVYLRNLHFIRRERKAVTVS